MCRSVPQMPQRPTFRTSSPAAGVGSGRVSITSGLPALLNTAAFMRSFQAVPLDVVRVLLAQLRLAEPEAGGHITMPGLLLRRLLLQPVPHAPHHVLAQLQIEASVDGAHHADRIGVE